MPAVLTVVAHKPDDPEVYLDPQVLGEAKEGDIAELWCSKGASRSTSGHALELHEPGPDVLRTAHKAQRRASAEKLGESGKSKGSPRAERRNLYFRVRAPPPTAKMQPATISVSSTVLNLLGIRPRSHLNVRLVSQEQQRERVQLDVVEVHFKGVYLTRNDQYRMGKRLTGCCVYAGQKLTYLNDLVRLSVDTLFQHGRKRFSGYIDDDTRLVFRSDSARMLVFIQMSAEMWNFDETGDIMFHQLVNSFIPEMLHRWHTQGDSHLVSIILFTSVAASRRSNASSRLSAGVLEKNTLNFYRVVVDSVHISRWSDIMRTLRREFERFPEEVLVDPETHELRGYFLPSSKSNIMEAFSLATTLLTHKFLDKDLCRTGSQALIVTPGSACFDVDLSDLYTLSKRLLGVEIGIELVCLARPPLHVTPLFRALLPILPGMPAGREPTLEGVTEQPPNTRFVYCVPTWINMSFWSTQDRYVKQWIPRCKIYDLQMVGLIENEVRSVGLKSLGFKPIDISMQFMRAHDAGLFKSVSQIESEKRVDAAAKTSQSSELRPAKLELFTERSRPAVTPSVALPEVPVTDVEPVSPATTAEQPPARQSLGALLKSQKGAAKVRKASSRWSLYSLRPASAAPTSAQEESPTKPTASVPNSQKNSHQTKQQEPAALTTPTPSASIAVRHRRTSSMTPGKFDAAASAASVGRSSLVGLDIPRHKGKVRWPSNSSPRSAYRDLMGPSSTSPSRDHPVLSTSPGTAAGAFCEVTKPETQPVSMWRVLANPAVIDNPSRVRAYGRWANVYPPHKKLSSVSWHSLRSPASLPLTSESFPNLKNFRDQYKFQFYDLAVDSEELTVSQLLDEMICLRMQMGFQIAVGPNVHIVEGSLPRGNPGRVVPIVPMQSRDCMGVRIYMTRMGLIHRLAVDTEQTVNVQLYTWVDPHTNSLRSPVNQGRKQENLVKTRHDTSYHAINRSFLDLGLEHLNWSLLDQQVGGFDDPLLDPSSANAKNLVAIRYVLVPADMTVVPGYESLNAEEGHVEGITRFVRSLLRNRETGPSHSDFIVHFYTGQISKAISDVIHDSDNKLLELNRLNKSASLADIAAEMRGKMGIPFKDRRWHWKYFRQVFLGHDFVVWLVKTFTDISSPEEAEEFARQLMAKGLFRHPEDRHPFIDGHYFYELCQDYVTALPASNTDATNSETKLKDEHVDESTDEQQKPPQPQQQQRARINVSQSFVLNVDPKRVSNRPERVRVSIDRMHNPKNAYHILVEWLNATPRLVDEMFSGLGRMMTSYGLRMIQVPVADVTGSLEDSPFRSALVTRLAVEPADEDDALWFHVFVLRKMGYVLDIHDRRLLHSDDYDVSFSWGRLNAATPQHIHRTGFVLVQLRPDGSLYIAPNTLHLSRAVLALGSNLAANAESETESIIQELDSLCRDESRLREMLDEAQTLRSRSRETRSVSSLESASLYASVTRQSSRHSSRHSSQNSSKPPSRQSSVPPRPLSGDYSKQS